MTQDDLNTEKNNVPLYQNPIIIAISSFFTFVATIFLSLPAIAYWFINEWKWYKSLPLLLIAFLLGLFSLISFKKFRKTIKKLSLQHKYAKIIIRLLGIAVWLSLLLAGLLLLTFLMLMIVKTTDYYYDIMDMVLLYIDNGN